MNRIVLFLLLISIIYANGLFYYFLDINCQMIGDPLVCTNEYDCYNMVKQIANTHAHLCTMPVKNVNCNPSLNNSNIHGIVTTTLSKHPCTLRPGLGTAHNPQDYMSLIDKMWNTIYQDQHICVDFY